MPKIMNFPFYLSTRYLRSTQKGSFTRIAGILSVAGLAVGIAALLITLFILNGFERVISQKISDFDGHIRIRHFLSNPIQRDIAGLDRVQANYPNLISRSSFIQGQALLRKGKQAEGVVVEGLEPNGMGFISSMIVDGKPTIHPNETIIGQRLADQLDISIGDRIVLFDIETLHGTKKRLGQFMVSGLYHSGMTEYDHSLVFIDLEGANRLFAMDGTISGEVLRLNEANQYRTISQELSNALAYPYMVINWKEKNRALFKWMDVQRWPILFIFGLIALVGVVNIVSALAMVIIDKTRQIGLLKSLGITQGDLKKVFLIKGLIIGLSGALGGALLAILLATLQNTFKWIKVPEDVYFMDFIPVDVSGGDIGVIFLFSVATSILAAWWPTVRTNKIEPSSALKYE